MGTEEEAQGSEAGEVEIGVGPRQSLVSEEKFQSWKRQKVDGEGSQIHPAEPESAGESVEPVESLENEIVCPEDVEYWKKLEFTTIEEAHEFYTNYAYRVGFKTRKEFESRRSSKNKMMDRVYYAKYVCNKEGFKKGSKLDPKNQKKPFSHIEATYPKRNKSEERTGCGAEIRMQFIVSRGVYIITKWVGEHNHELYPREFSHMLRSNAGSRLKSTDDVMSIAAGGNRSLGLLETDLKNHLPRRRQREMKYGEATALQEYFRNEAYQNPSFYYDIQVDNEERIANIFWADGRMKMDYSFFGDSITFDLTYKTNKGYLPLAVFIGFNHHHQGCILGAALLFDETTESFEWLFRTFLRCMSNKAPLTIFTDIDAAMTAALKSVLPTTYHALSTWHIMQSEQKNLGPLYSSVFATKFSFLMYEVDDEDEFDSAWRKMITECFPDKGPTGHEWLEKIHSMRKQWSSAWVKQYFTAGMITTQLIKFCNSSIKGYLQSDHNLVQFFTHFNRMVEDKRRDEKLKDFEAMKKVPRNNFPYSPIVRCAAEHYTPNIFAMFQEQYQQMFEYMIEPNPSMNEGTKVAYHIYKLADNDSTKTDKKTVLVDAEDIILECTCRLYETFGLLCRHILKVMDVLGSTGNSHIRTMPSRYIKKRWTRKAKCGGEYSCTRQGDRPSLYGERYRSLCSKMILLATRACTDDNVYNMVANGLDVLCERTEKMLASSGVDASQGQSSVQDSDSSARKVEAVRMRTEDVASGTIQMNGRELFLHEPWVFDNTHY